MPTESFFKNFAFTSQESLDAFCEELENPSPKRKIRRNLCSQEDQKAGEEKLKAFLTKKIEV